MVSPRAICLGFSDGSITGADAFNARPAPAGGEENEHAECELTSPPRHTIEISRVKGLLHTQAWRWDALTLILRI